MQCLHQSCIHHGPFYSPYHILRRPARVKHIFRATHAHDSDSNAQLADARRTTLAESHLQWVEADEARSHLSPQRSGAEDGAPPDLQQQEAQLEADDSRSSSSSGASSTSAETTATTTSSSRRRIAGLGAGRRKKAKSRKHGGSSVVEDAAEPPAPRAHTIPARLLGQQQFNIPSPEAYRTAIALQVAKNAALMGALLIWPAAVVPGGFYIFRIWALYAAYVVLFSQGISRRALAGQGPHSAGPSRRLTPRSVRSQWPHGLFIIAITKLHWEAVVYYCTVQYTLATDLTLSEVLGVPAVVAALWLHHKAASQLGPAYNHGHPPGQLVTSGVYRRLQHPIYTAYTLLFFGATLLLHSAAVTLLVLLACALYYRWRAREEAACLAEEFGEQYEQYAACTPRFMPRREAGSSSIREQVQAAIGNVVQAVARRINGNGSAEGSPAAPEAGSGSIRDQVQVAFGGVMQAVVQRIKSDGSAEGAPATPEADSSSGIREQVQAAIGNLMQLVTRSIKTDVGAEGATAPPEADGSSGIREQVQAAIGSVAQAVMQRVNRGAGDQGATAPPEDHHDSSSSSGGGGSSSSSSAQVEEAVGDVMQAAMSRDGGAQGAESPAPPEAHEAAAVAEAAGSA